MPRDLTIHKSKWKENTLWHYLEIIPLHRVAKNFTLLWIARRMWSMPFKNKIYRWMGAKVGKNVSIGLEASMELFYPELVEIGDNTIIGMNVMILTHEMLIDEWHTGRVIIGKNCVIGANSTILAGVKIADNTTVSAHSLVNSHVSGFVGGVPARPLKKEDVTLEQ